METMRREGYEFQVSPPKVLYKTIDGVRCEPFERLIADVPESAVGAVMSKNGRTKKGELLHMSPIGSRTRLEFLIPPADFSVTETNFLPTRAAKAL